MTKIETQRGNLQEAAVLWGGGANVNPAFRLERGEGEDAGHRTEARRPQTSSRPQSCGLSLSEAIGPPLHELTPRGSASPRPWV